MVQFALQTFLSALASVGAFLVPLGVVLLGALLALAVLGALDRERVRSWLGSGRSVLPRLGAWLLAGLALALSLVALRVVRQAVNVRLGAQENARYSSEAEAEGSATVQPAPSATYLTEKTYSRTLTLPPDFLERLGADAVGALAPYLTDPSSENITRLADTFRRSGKTVVFTRDATLRTQEPIKLDQSKVSVGLSFLGPLQGGRKTYYNADFQGEYVFHNPLSQAAPVRFVFPLPYGSGTLSNFELTANGTPVTVTDLQSGYVWEDTLPGGGEARVKVRYHNQGARGWSYQLASRREPITNFDLTVQADRPAKFARYSLFPTERRSSALGGQSTLRWQLRNVITAQNVALTFSSANLRETLLKVFSFAPAALLLACVFAGAWAWRRRLALTPVTAILGILGFALGLGVLGVLTGYLPPVLAGMLGAALAAGLATLALGRAFVWPLALSALAPLAFLWTGNAGLLLSVLGVLALLSLRRVPLQLRR